MAASIPLNNHTAIYLAGGGEMGALIRAYNWEDTALGRPEQWPQNLLITISTMLRSKFPMFLWWGPDLIQFYNDAYRPSLGEDGKHPTALGQKGKDCWVEAWPTIGMWISQVMKNGNPVWHEDQLLPIYRNGQLEQVYWTFGYSGIINEDGSVAGVLVICNETTGKVINKQHIAEGLIKQKLLNEDVKKSNQLLATANEKLKLMNEELAIAQKNLSDSFNNLRYSELNFRNMILQAPVAVCIMLGEKHTIAVANQKIIELWGKPEADIMDKPIFDALPDAAGQGLERMLNAVYNEGRSFEAFEYPVTLLRNGQEETVYQNFTYQPYKNTHGDIVGVVAITIDVTESVLARKEMEKAYEQARLSKEAAELGTFDMDLIKGTMEWDNRCRILFGISHQNPVNYEEDFVKGLHPEDRERIIAIIEGVFVKAVSGGKYDVEYRTVGAEDGKIRWVKAKGQAYFDEKDEPIRFIGSVLDITEQKNDELRKNDFIGMVSHELKTPLTSLNGYTQVLTAKAIQNNDAFAINALSKVNKQIHMMKSLINGFLNVSRLQSGKIVLQKNNFLLDVLIHDLIDEFKFTSPTHPIYFEPCKAIKIRADLEKISSVVSNLISNAIKYSPIGSPITVSCEVCEPQVKISVADQGIGIPEEDKSKLFDRFYRVNHKTTQHISGFGIGLYLCAEIVKHHQGEIWVESTMDQGSVFSFTLPLGR